MTPRIRLPYDGAVEGRVVRLTPLSWDDVPALMEIARAAPEEYELTSTPRDDAEGQAYFSEALAEVAAGTAHVVTVRDLSGAVIGTSRLRAYDARHARCELGYTWYHPRVFRTAVNTECKLLLLELAFEGLGVHRVQIQTDARNLRSQRAILALGAQFEGVLRRHMVAKDGYVRDSVIFSITDVTWPTVRLRLRERLEERLARDAATAAT